MAVKKKNNFSINISEKAMKVLQVMGYIDGRKKLNKDKNFSAFFSGLVEDHIIFHPELNTHDINLKVHLDDMRELNRQQAVIGEKMKHVSIDITNEREILRNMNLK